MALCRGDAEVASWPLEQSGYPDLAVVDELARLLLAARRMGYSLRLRDACTGLLELLELVGLSDLVTEAGLGQMDGQAEGREQLGVEEVVVPDDPVA